MREDESYAESDETAGRKYLFHAVSSGFADRKSASPLSSIERAKNRLKSSRPNVSLIFWSACLILIFFGFIQPFNHRIEAPSPTHAKPTHFYSTPPSLPISQEWLSLTSENFHVIYPAQLDERDAESVLSTLEDARADMSRRLSSASLTLPSLKIEVVIHASTGDFTAMTAQPFWSAAVTHGARIELQPTEMLRLRGVLVSTLRHEYAHAVIEALSCGRAPRVPAEGLAAHFANEGARLARYEPKNRLSSDEIERRMSLSHSPREMAVLYAAAYLKVRDLIHAQGEARVWQSLAIADLENQ